MNPIQQRIAQNINHFDVCSLLELLYEIGYQSSDIYFESHADTSSRSSLCEKIIFSEKHPKVRLLLNIGLLAGNSPLPNFFRKKMDTGSIDPVLFTRYLHFFDHHLINNLLAMSMPDINTTFFSSWQETKGHYLKLLDLNSTSTLWHLFQTCFPELKISVLKAPKVFKRNSSSVMLGKTRLGVESFLGKKIVQTMPSFKIMLTGDETNTDLMVPWPIAIKERLKKMIFPILQRTHIHFRIIFIQKDGIAYAHLRKNTQLGYCMLGKGFNPLKILLFSGYSKDLLL
ncbi:MAG: hypothetical protein H0V82_05490 [Candidatus Protochlamydia sp.]|nr:hypothetical protein [Candidatus Protochlamydia sp.]